MASFNKPPFRDYVFWGLLLLFAAIPLIVLRGTEIRSGPIVTWGSVAIWLIICSVWLKKSVGSGSSNDPEESLPPSHSESKSTVRGIGHVFLVVLTLGIFTLVAFYLPMRLHWWSGTDEWLTAGIDTIWYGVWDKIHARPLAGLPFYIALHLTPNRFDGYIWLNVFFRFASSLLVYGIVRETIRSGRLLAVMAAVLFVVNPSEPIRFIDGALCYYSPVFFFLLAVWLYFVSQSRQSRFLLLLSCISLGASLLQYETPFPLSVFAPVIIYFRTDKQGSKFWAFAWYGTVALFAARFLHHVFTDASLYHVMLYRAGNVPTTFLGHVKMILENLVIQVAPVFEYINHFKGLPAFWLKGCSALIPAIPLLIWTARQNQLQTSRKVLGWGIILSGIAVVLGISPFTVLPITQIIDFSEHPTMRFQFYAAPFQATFWAFLISFVSSLIKARWRPIFSVAMVSILVVASVAGAYQFQSHHGYWNPQADLKITSRILNQARARMPEMKDKNYSLFFIIDEKQDSPLGWAYGVYHMSCLLFGVPGYQGRMTQDGVLEFRYQTGYAADRYAPIPDCTTVVFRVSSDWKLTDFVEVHPPKEAGNKKSCPDCVARFLDPPPDQPLPFLIHE